MRVFLTGATGFIGSRIVRELISARHTVVGLARSETSAAVITAAGAEAHRGDLEHLESLRSGAAGCDAVIHTAFDHDPTKGLASFVETCRKDGHVIEALGSALEGSERPIVLTSSTTMGSAGPNEPATEDFFDPNQPNPRIASELAGRALSERGVNVSVVRLSQIHDTRKQGFVTELIALARTKGFSAYIGDGTNPWSAAHVTDTALLFRLALERREAGARYHATSEEAIPFRDIAETIGLALGVPAKSIAADEAAAHFGYLSTFASKGMSASSLLTRERLGWRPHGAGLLADIRNLDHTAP